jgi:hypothetical protein
MSANGLVTDAELSRARADPAFRHRLVADSLELLLGRLNNMRGAQGNSKQARQVREAVKLAVQLADLLQRIATEYPAGAGARAN